MKELEVIALTALVLLLIWQLPMISRYGRRIIRRVQKKLFDRNRD